MLGVCYYPEHWPENMWAQDAREMFELGLKYVRIGEFAWSRLESSPGVFHFDWLDRAIETLAGAGLSSRWCGRPLLPSGLECCAALQSESSCGGFAVPIQNMMYSMTWSAWG